MKYLSSLLLALLPSVAVGRAILGVDMGSLYMKVALVQRGAPLEIVTNLHSKRKTENMIMFDAGTRFYGADANSLYGRKPQKTPSALNVMLGRDDEHPASKVLSERHYPILPVFNETRAGVSLKVESQEFTPEELVAMVLDHAKEMTVAYAASQGAAAFVPKDVVLTVPSFATQHERRALLDAAMLADMNVLSLVDENTAAALHFGMDKIMEEPKIYVFYNLGASSLQVSVVRYLSYEIKESKYSKKGKTVGGLEVLGKAWDSTLGGLALDHRIVEYLADEFNQVWGKGDVRDYARPMAKLRIQANKIKHVLSANTAMPVYIDALYDDTPLKAHVTREKLEELCGDILDRAVKPIEDALARANITLKDVDAIELIGGGMRVPKIQSRIQEFLGKDLELGMHINSDESMALGASFHGANISTAFKVRHVGMADINPFPIAISLNDIDPAPTEGDEEEWSKQATMFKSGGKVGVKKTIAFTHDKDVSCAVGYEESDILPAGTQTSIERYNVTGVAKFAEEMKEKGLGQPKVSLQFELSNSGITRLVKAEAACEEIVIIQEEVEVEDGEETADEAATGEEKTKEEEKEEEEAASEGEEAEKTGDVEAKADEEEKKEEEKKKKKTKMVDKEKKKMHKRTLSVASYFTGKIQPYSVATMADSMAKMAELERKDKERKMLEESRNKVESYIYYIKNKLSDDEENIGKVSTEEQRQEILKLAEDAEEWMYDDGYNADLATMEDKYAELSTPAEKIFFRVSEMTARPEAVKALKEKFEKMEALMTKWETEKPQVTEDERQQVLDKIGALRKDLAEKEEAQSKVSATEEPAFKSSDLEGVTKPVRALIERLNRKPKPKPPKNDTKADGENATKSENKTTAGEDEETEASETKEEETKADEEKAEGEPEAKEEPDL